MSSKKKSSSEQKENSNDAPLSPYERILACRTNPPGPPEYLVKLREKSYKNSKWISTEDLQKDPVSQSKLTRFIKTQREYPIDPPYYDPQYDIIDRIICKKDRKYFVKWMGLGYDQATWEKADSVTEEALEDFNLRQKQIHPLKSGDINKIPTLNIERLNSYKFGDNELESYQLATMNLLLNNYSKMKNTDIVDRYNSQLHVSCAAFFEYILQSSLSKENNQAPTTRTRRTRSQKIDENEILESENGGEFGPVLIVAPLPSTIKWYNAFRSIQNATTINYTGQKEGRQVAVETDFYYNEDKLKFHALVTTPEILSNNMKTLSEIKWRIAIFDDANRLKNPKSKFALELQHFAIGFQIALMQSQPNYTALKKITDLLIESCTNPYIDEEVKKAAQTVRSQIQPKVLKRKSQSAFDEEKESFATYYVDCPLSETQRKILKEIIRESGRYVQKKNFIPLCQRILRICTHPFLLYSKEFYLNGVDLISSSTKLNTLQELLIDEISAPMNRILIMSDFSLMLDMIEDVINVHEIKNERIVSQSKEVLHEDATVFLYNPKYCAISPSLFKTMTTIIVVDGEGTELKELLQTNKPPNLHKIYKFHCRDCSEDTLTRMCIINNINYDEVQPNQCESICKLAALAAYSDKQVPDSKNILKKAAVVMNSFNPNDILEKEFDSCDFWSYLVDEEKTNKTQITEYEKEDTLVANIDDESEIHTWTSRERDQVLRGLCRFGFNRWKKMRIQTGLKVNVKNIFSASRALVREMIRILGSSSGHAVTREFLKESSLREEDEANDRTFITNSCFNDPDFKFALTTNYTSYLREIENVHFLTEVADEKDVYEISIPHPSGQLPKWWKDTYDQYLVYGTCKYGLGCYDQFVEDNNQDILKIFGPSDDPIKQKDLTERAMKLAEMLKRKQSSGQRNDASDKSSNKKDNAAYQPPNSGQNNSDSEFSSSSSSGQSSISYNNGQNSSSSSISSRRKSDSGHSFDDSSYGSEPRTRMKKELKSDIYQFLIRYGVPEDEKGNADYEAFARDSGLSRYLAVDDVKDLVEDYLRKCNIPPEEGGNPPNTSNKINQRCLAMKKLREIMRDDDLAPLIFEYTPHWRQLPKEWTPRIEYYYFREILQIGLINDTYENILKGSEFGKIHDENPPPPFIYDTSKVMRRIDVIYNSMQEGLKNGKLSKNQLTLTPSPASSAPPKPKKPAQQSKGGSKPSQQQQPPLSSSSKKIRKAPVPNGYTLQSNRTLFPADRAIFDGRVVFPLNLGDGQILLSLGTIIPDREDFYNDRYIYPIGYKASNRLPSATEKDTITQWISEIGVENEENEEIEPNPNLLDQSNRLVFRAWMQENPTKVYTGQSPNAVWAAISNDINELNGGEKQTISGIDAFLLSNQAVIYIIQHMKGSKRCHNYKAKPVDLPPFAQKMRDWTQNLGVPFGQAALNEPTVEAASKTKPPPKKKSTKKKADLDDEAFGEEGNENKEDSEEEEEEESLDETEEEEEEDFEEEEEEKKKKKQTKSSSSQKKSTKTENSQPKNNSKSNTTTQPSSSSSNKKSNSSSSKKQNKQNIQQQQQSIQMNPLQLNQMPGSVLQNPMIQKVPPQFAMPSQTTMMQGYLPYNKPGMLPNNPMMPPNMMQQNLMQNPQQTKNLPPNFFMQNNVQNGPLVQNNLPQGFMKPPGFIQTQPMQNFIQQPGVIQPNNMMKSGNPAQLPLPPNPPDPNAHTVKQESNFNDSNPVSNQ